MIIYSTYDPHPDQTHNAEQDLSFKVKQAVSVLFHHCAVRARTIYHDQSKADQADQYCQQTVIEVCDAVFFLFHSGIRASFFIFFYHILLSNRIYYTQIRS